MSEPPSPPDHGWTLCEAAALLFPVEWAAATLPEDDVKARSHPGIAPSDDPLMGIPIERARRIMAAASARDHGQGYAVEVPNEDEGLVEASRAYEAQIAANIATARKAAEAAQGALPRLFADRMQRGDLLAYGVNMAAGAHAPPTPIQPHLWGVAKPHFGFDSPTTSYLGRRSYTMPAPEAGTVTGLPGGLRLRAVRIKAARPSNMVDPSGALAARGPADASLAVLAASPVPGGSPEISATGAPGRPTSMHVVRDEHARRLMSGAAKAAVSAEASHLADWFRAAYPKAPSLTAKTIENAIREAHRQPRPNPPK
jgi:hypothetical protein